MSIYGSGQIRAANCLCLLVALAVGGCNDLSQIAVPPDAFAARQGQKLTLVTYGLTDFGEKTMGSSLAVAAGGVIGGALGGVIVGAATTGNPEDAIHDPALELSTQLFSWPRTN